MVKGGVGSTGMADGVAMAIRQRRVGMMLGFRMRR